MLSEIIFKAANNHTGLYVSIHTGSEQVKSTVSCQLGVSYGDSDEQKLDIFGAEHLPGGR